MDFFGFLSNFDTEYIYAFGFLVGFVFSSLFFLLCSSVSSFFTKHFVIAKIFKFLKIQQSNLVIDLNELEISKYKGENK